MIPNFIQFRAARAALGWSVDDVAGKAEMDRRTVMKLESPGNADAVTIDAALRVKHALEQGGIVFVWADPIVGIGEGLRLSAPGPGFEAVRQPIAVESKSASRAPRKAKAT